MNIDDEQKILSEAPDFDNQRKILEEEKAIINKRRNWYILILSMVVLIALIFVFSFSRLHHYHEYGGSGPNNCPNVNLKVDGSLVPNLNISEGKDCIPIYNIDYFNNRKATFNIDLFGDRSEIFNKVNQRDGSGVCYLNCDSNKDGWPDYNIDLDGNGTADVNIVKSKPSFCDLNCDINNDMIPDTNIDTNGDGVADVNITNKKDHTKPVSNIDYMGNRVPTFNINNNGEIKNPITDAVNNPLCQQNCDIDSDGWPDYNIKLNDNDPMINSLVASSETSVVYDRSKDIPWRCYFSRNLDECRNETLVKSNTYANIDVDGDGKADVNILNEDGTYTNPINNSVTIEGQTITLNEDKDLDGFPDFNIDANNDGTPDLNITENGSYECVANCDINKDGSPDYLIQIGNNKITHNNLNIDYNYDKTCDVNCDLDLDLYPDINLDVDGDVVPDINIDFDHDGVPDYNIDLDGDFKPDKNIDAYGLGECNFNCENSLVYNPVNTGVACTVNCDTDNNGYPDKNVDIDGDGTCDFNCDNDNKTIDKDNNYFIDSEYGEDITLLEIGKNDKNNFYITNPLSIKALDIEPGWEGKYVLTITNDSNNAVAYKVIWSNVTNDYTDANNLDYFITRSRTSYLNNLNAPKRYTILENKAIIKANATIRYVLDIEFAETGTNQNVDSGKTFYGQFKVEVIK